MSITNDLEAARSAVQTINAAPYNAEAPPEALIGDITGHPRSVRTRRGATPPLPAPN